MPLVCIRASVWGAIGAMLRALGPLIPEPSWRPASARASRDAAASSRAVARRAVMGNLVVFSLRPAAF